MLNHFLTLSEIETIDPPKCSLGDMKLPSIDRSIDREREREREKERERERERGEMVFRKFRNEKV